MRSKPTKTSNRKDSSTVQLPIASVATISPIAGGVKLNVAAGIIAQNPSDPDGPVGITLNNSAGSFDLNLVVAQVDQFNVTVTHPDLLPGTFSGTLKISPAMTGIRGARGGNIVIGEIVFP